MAEQWQLPLPMWTVQSQLLGGTRRMLSTGSLYVAAVAAAWFGFRALEPKMPADEVAAGALYLLAAVNLGWMGLGGCGSIHKATTRDLESKMIESHRLTPMSNLAVALGYLFGPTAQVLFFFGINFLIGLLLTTVAQMPLVGWVWGCLLLFSTAVMVWSATVVAGVGASKGTNPSAALILIAVLVMPISILPGAGLMCGVYAAFLSYWLMAGESSPNAFALTVVLLVNLAMTLFWVLAAAARYRRPDLPVFNPLRGLVLLTLWLLLAFAGLSAMYSPQLKGLGGIASVDMVPGQWIATILLSVLVALPAIHGAVVCQHLIQRGSSARDWSDRLPDWQVTLLAGLMICAAAAAVGSLVWPAILQERTTLLTGFDMGVPVHRGAWSDDFKLQAERNWAYTIAAVMLALLTARGVLIMAVSTTRWVKSVSVLVLVGVWVLPHLVDSLRPLFQEEPRAFRFSWLFGLSPAGTVVIAWAGMAIPVLPGLVFQAAVALVVSLFGWSKRRAVRRQVAAAREKERQPAVAEVS